MTTAQTMWVMAVMTFCLAAMARAAEPQGTGEKTTGKKPVDTCKQIVETFKVTNSVDETSDSLMVDQKRVVACLKAAGIKYPPEYDR